LAEPPKRLLALSDISHSFKLPISDTFEHHLKYNAPIMHRQE